MRSLAKTSFIGRQMFCRLRGRTQRSTVFAIALAAPHQSCLRVAPGHLETSHVETKRRGLGALHRESVPAR
jgi:hypothetical protein